MASLLRDHIDFVHTLTVNPQLVHFRDDQQKKVAGGPFDSLNILFVFNFTTE